MLPGTFLACLGLYYFYLMHVGPPDNAEPIDGEMEHTDKSGGWGLFKLKDGALQIDLNDCGKDTAGQCVGLTLDAEATGKLKKLLNNA